MVHSSSVSPSRIRTVDPGRTIVLEQPAMPLHCSVRMGYSPVNRRSASAQSVGELIAAERERRSLTRRDLAMLIGKAAAVAGERYCRVNEKSVYRWEHGDVPRANHLRWLAAALELPVDHLTCLAPRDATNGRTTIRSGVNSWNGPLAHCSSTIPNR